MKQFLVILLLASTVGFAQTEAIQPQTQSPSKIKYDSFANLRNEVLTAIGGATQRIMLTTDFLSDGEIVTALYIAQYRKISVTVLLGKAKANSYMSRLNYLKAQNIPVFIKPARFSPSAPTIMLVDQNLYIVNGELDFLAKYRSFEIRYGSEQEKEQYMKSFADATQQAIPAIPHQTPMVGRPNLSRRAPAYSPSKPAGNIDGVEDSQAIQAGGQQEGDSFRYFNDPKARPANVPDKLPKTTIWQKKAREADQASGNKNETSVE